MGKILNFNFLTIFFHSSKGGTLGIFWKNWKKIVFFFILTLFLQSVVIIIAIFFSKIDLKYAFVTKLLIANSILLWDTLYQIDDFNHAILVFHNFLGDPQKIFSPNVQGVPNKKNFWDTLYFKLKFHIFPIIRD